MYIDQHLHTTFSHDGKATIEDYIRLGASVYTVTDHFDLGEACFNKQDRIFDCDDYFKTLNQAEQDFKVTILKGIEIGFHKDRVDEINDYLNNYPFDVVLLSVHHNTERDYMDPRWQDDPKGVVRDYFETVLLALNSSIKANISTHLDYAMRKREVPLEMVKDFKNYTDEIFQLIIEKNMSFEINTKSMFHYMNEELYWYYVDEYIRLGGTKFTISSDCHFTGHFQFEFDSVVEGLKKRGIHKTYYFKNRVEHTIDL